MVGVCQLGDCGPAPPNCSLVASCGAVTNVSLDTWLPDSCHVMDADTCDATFWARAERSCAENFSYSYDMDGCHDMGLARAACFYRDYMRVKHVLGTAGIGHNFQLWIYRYYK